MSASQLAATPTVLTFVPNNTNIPLQNGSSFSSLSSSTETLTLGNAQTPTDKIQKCIQQVEHKQKYNKSYYQERTKPKIIAKKQEYETLKDKCALYETHIQTLLAEKQESSDQINKLVQIIEQLKINCNQLYNDNCKLSTDNSKLIEDNSKLLHDNIQLSSRNSNDEKNISN